MLRVLTAALLGAGMMASGASAAPAKGVEVTNGVYSKSVCQGPVSPNFARCFAHVVTDAAGNLAAGKVNPNTTPRGFGPPDLQSAYAATSGGDPSTLVAIVDAFGYDNAETDLGVYRAQYSLPPCTTANGCFKKVNQGGHQGNYPAQNIGWAQESALDLDMVSSMCPNCKIVLVEARTNSLKHLAQSVDEAAALGAHVISNSYGGSEKKSPPFEGSYNHPGVAITASTGDSGYGVAFPATSPHVTAVGGTTLMRAQNTRGWNETVWNGAGSGCSNVYAKPAWQKDHRCQMRMEADVSAVANPATGVAVYGPTASGSSAWLVFGGTSVAAPLVGGVYGANGGKVNYAADAYHNTDTLNDVTTGTNGTCRHDYFCHGEVGYDGPTGLGTPIGDTAFGRHK